MNWILPVRSRFGNQLFVAIGALICVSSAGLLVYYLIDSWGYATLLDRLLQVILLAATLIGLFMGLGARNSLKSSLGSSEPHRA